MQLKDELAGQRAPRVGCQLVLCALYPHTVVILARHGLARVVDALHPLARVRVRACEGNAGEEERTQTALSKTFRRSSSSRVSSADAAAAARGCNFAWRIVRTPLRQRVVEAPSGGAAQTHADTACLKVGGLGGARIPASRARRVRRRAPSCQGHCGGRRRRGCALRARGSQVRERLRVLQYPAARLHELLRLRAQLLHLRHKSPRRFGKAPLCAPRCASSAPWPRRAASPRI